MKNKHFQVIADIYNLLAQYDATELQEASRYEGASENICKALRALSREVPRASKEPHSERNASAQPRRVHVLDALMDKENFPTKAHLARLARTLGMSLKITSRDSRERIARRIANQAARNEKLARKLGNALTSGDNQTEGWLDLILGEK